MFIIIIIFSYSFSTGTAQSIGCKVEGCHPHDVINQIDNGQVDLPRE